MASWAEEYLTLIEDCEKRESRLTDWERGFMDSLRASVESGHHPTHKQIEKLDAIWERATKHG